MIVDERLSIDGWLVEKGTEVTFSLLAKFEEYAETDCLPKRIAVKVPVNRGRGDAFPMPVKNASQPAFA